MNLILVTSLIVLVASIQARNAPECTWNTYFLERKHPLYVKIPDRNLELNINEFWLPQSGDKVTVPHNTEVIFSCPGKKLLGLVGNEQERVENVQEAVLKCMYGGLWEYKGVDQEFDKLICDDYPTITIKDMRDTCNVNIPNTKLLKIGFLVNEAFYTIIETCFKGDTQDSIYSKNILTPAVEADYSTEVDKKDKKRTNWITDHDYYGSINIDKKYICGTYSKTLMQLLRISKSKLEELYVDCEVNSKKRLTRGHLSANVDLPYFPIRKTTFRFINAAPQWLSVNSGNWKILEEKTRELVIKSYVDLLVYSGTHGVTTLLDVDDKNVPLYLYEKGRIQITGKNNDDGNDNGGGGNYNNVDENGKSNNGGNDNGGGNNGGNDNGGNDNGGNDNGGGNNGGNNNGGGNNGGNNNCDVKVDDCNANEKIYKISVPELYWRVVYDPRTKRGTAIVVMNNPYHDSFQQLCEENVFDRINWLNYDGTLKPNDQNLGYTYCCDVNELSQHVMEIPELDVIGLLTE